MPFTLPAIPMSIIHEKPRYSLVLPVYNNVRTLSSTLASLECLGEKHRWEIIISDDCSTDATCSIVTAWIAGPGAAFGRCKLVANKKNVGISGNHATGFAAVTSEYALYIGGDDLINNPHLASDLDNALADAPGTRIAKLDVEALYSGTGRRESLYRYKRSFFEMSSHRQFVALALFGNFLYAGPGTLLHVPMLREIGGGFDPRFRTYEDIPLFYNFLSSGYRMRFLPVKGVVWYRSSFSLSRSGFALQSGRYAEEGRLARAFVQERMGSFTAYERLLFRIRGYPKYVRYLLYAFHPSWLRNRLVPSIIKKIGLIKRGI
jgi:glycosyltransferase involved in cell wall biosynthesis